MGIFSWPLRIADMDDQRTADVEATVGTGAFYTQLPTSLLRELGVEPLFKRRLQLADGRLIDADIGEARATIDGESVTTLVVFGEDGSPPLLGAYTLEGLALTVDPIAERLVPRELTLYARCAA
ncbi:MAG: hypothetical protein OXG69_12130 [bacterium]|nr:hypothetical protein [bacterium]